MIHVVIGTKAQLIKMAPILRKLKDRGIPYNHISTGQHRETIDDLLGNFELKSPDWQLYSGRDITSIPQMLAWSLRILWKSARERRQMFQDDPHGIVLVHGDTFSTLLGAVMGKMAGLRVGHVEAGLRSFNLLQPFPEELMRIGTMALSDFLFCPGEQAIGNIGKHSGVKVDTRMNTVLDTLAIALPSIESLEGAAIPDHDYAVVTMHRFENFRTRETTLAMVRAIERIAERIPLVFIMHMPTERNLKKHGLYERVANHPRIECRGRTDYFRFMKLVLGASFLVSDGGTNQTECYFLGKPLLLLRNVTELEEGIGRNVVVSQFDDGAIDHFLDNLSKYRFERSIPSFSPSDTIIAACDPFM